jgi:hypothetical protein
VEQKSWARKNPHPKVFPQLFLREFLEFFPVEKNTPVVILLCASVGLQTNYLCIALRSSQKSFTSEKKIHTFFRVTFLEVFLHPFFRSIKCLKMSFTALSSEVWWHIFESECCLSCDRKKKLWDKKISSNKIRGQEKFQPKNFLGDKIFLHQLFLREFFWSVPPPFF